MNSRKRSPLAICCAVLLAAAVLVLYAMGLTGWLFGPSDWALLSLWAFLLTFPTVLLILLVVPGSVPTPQPIWLRACRYVVGGMAALCVGATIVSILGLLVTAGGAGSIKAGDHEPVFVSEGPYLLSGEPVSRARWMAAAIAFSVGWHCFGASWILVVLYLTVYRRSDAAIAAETRSPLEA